MKPIHLLHLLEKRPKEPLTDEITTHLAQIKALCDQHFSYQNFYGNAALNRRMLLNATIAEHLTPDVLKYLFTNQPEPTTMIYRDSCGKVALRDAIYYGFVEGLNVLQFMPNNEPEYGPSNYQTQKINFQSHTLRIVKSIKIASGFTGEIDTQNFYHDRLLEQFDQIVRIINKVKKLIQQVSCMSLAIAPQTCASK